MAFWKKSSARGAFRRFLNRQRGGRRRRGSRSFFGKRNPLRRLFG